MLVLVAVAFVVVVPFPSKELLGNIYERFQFVVLEIGGHPVRLIELAGEGGLSQDRCWVPNVYEHRHKT